jgi:hypothetical protein
MFCAAAGLIVVLARAGLEGELGKNRERNTRWLDDTG